MAAVIWGKKFDTKYTGSKTLKYLTQQID